MNNDEIKFKEIDDKVEYKNAVLNLIVSHNLLKIDNFMTVVRQAIRHLQLLRKRGLKPSLQAIKKYFLEMSIKDISLKEIHSRFAQKGGIGIDKNWFESGVECELLKPNKNWRKCKARIKISLEVCFEDDETEENETKSPLDELGACQFCNLPIQRLFYSA